MRKIYAAFLLCLPISLAAQTVFTMDVTPASFTPSSVTVYVGDTVEFTTNSAIQVQPAAQVISTDPNYFDCGGISQFTPSCKVKINGGGVDTLNVNDSQHPANTGGVIYIIDTTTTVGVEMARDYRIRIYPNPATDRVVIDNRGLSATQLEFVNLVGQVVMQTPVSGNLNNLSVASMDKGIYFVRFMDGSKVLATKRMSIR